MVRASKTRGDGAGLSLYQETRAVSADPCYLVITWVSFGGIFRMVAEDPRFATGLWWQAGSQVGCC